MKQRVLGVTLLLAIPLCSANENNNGLSLAEAVRQSLIFDEWQTASRLQETAYRDEAEALASLPDPKLSLAVANLPTDSWDFDQENMTQLKLGVTQYFPGGDSRELKAKKSTLMAELTPFQRSERAARLTRDVSQLWLQSYLAARTRDLILHERYLFEQLVEVTTARYTSALGKARQQDIVQAQLALTKLEDRLTRLQMQHETNRQLLSQWLPDALQYQPLSQILPVIEPRVALDSQAIREAVKQHPLLRISDTRQVIRNTELQLAREQTRPGWALSAAYGHREDSPIGQERADFLSIGVTMDLPLFTEQRQDKQISAAYSRQKASAIDYQLLQRQLSSQALKTLAELNSLNARDALYQDRLLQQMHQQAEASLAAYHNDDGDFAEVMRAYIGELNSKIEALQIQVKQRQALATLNYLLAGVANSTVAEEEK